MKTHLFISVLIMSFLSLNSSAQTLKLWGTAHYGFGGSDGCIYKTDINGDNKEIVYKFYSDDRSLNGYLPSAGLVQATNNKLYGTTFGGGENDCGVLYEYDPANRTYTKKVDFAKETGKRSRASLIQATNGRLYGVLHEGGQNNWGTLFEYDIENETYTVLHYFNSYQGRWPVGVLLQADNGKLYGCADCGGDYGYGILFEFDIEENEYKMLKSFNEAGNGKGPNGNLIQADDGNIYGVATVGGEFYNGVIFQYNIEENTLIKVFDFELDKNGRYPVGSLLQLNDSSLIGLTANGGDYNLAGIIYSFNINDHSVTKLVDLPEGFSNPTTGFFQASNGKLFAAYTGSTNRGGVFEYDMQNGNTDLKVEGGYTTSRWIEIAETNTAIVESLVKNNIKLYPNPTNELATLEFDKNINVIQVNIWSMEGKLLRNYHDISAQKLMIDITNGNGIYMVEIITREGKAFLKLIKE